MIRLLSDSPLGISVLLSLTAALGCAASGAVGPATSADGVTRRDTRIVSEKCDIDSAGADKYDANGDGRPDLVIVSSGGREVCRAADLNFDGRWDSFSFFDASGKLRRQERDYDRDGQIEELTIYSAGVPTEQHRSTTLAGKLDTWHFFQNGKLTRTERDSDGDGVIDQWWEYKSETCPLIHSDVNGDGRPDPGATVDYCEVTGYVPPDRSGPRQTPSHTFEPPGSLPTELENKEQGETPEGGKK